MLRATLSRGAFVAEFEISEPTLAECYDVMNRLIKQMKFPRQKVKYVPMSITIQDAFEGEQELAERGQHIEQIHAHGLHYSLVEGTPELFDPVEPEPQAVTAEATVEAVKPARKTRKKRPTRRFPNVHAVSAWGNHGPL